MEVVASLFGLVLSVWACLHQVLAIAIQVVPVKHVLQAHRVDCTRKVAHQCDNVIMQLQARLW